MQRLEREAKNCASASFCASYENGWVGKKRWQGDGAKGLCPLQGKHLTSSQIKGEDAVGLPVT